MSFMIAVKKAGLKKFDAYAHNPYNGPRELPTTKPHTKGAYTLGNIGDMIKQVTKLWGRKRIWLTEYAYQTNPPDRAFGVSYAKQALYLKQAFAIARKQPRVDMMLWFQLKDEPGIGGWQSGLMTARARRSPPTSPSLASRTDQASAASSGASAAAPMTSDATVRYAAQRSVSSTGRRRSRTRGRSRRRRGTPRRLRSRRGASGGRAARPRGRSARTGTSQPQPLDQTWCQTPQNVTAGSPAAVATLRAWSPTPVPIGHATPVPPIPQ